MSIHRLRPAGFDARPERPSSLAAHAQRAYRSVAEQDAVLSAPTAPQNETPTALTQQIRALYETSAVPVAEIARLAGVSERTLYKYVQKGGWRRRYGGKGIAEANARRAKKRQPRACVTLKGAGGRFIRSEDADQPVRRGLAALDPEREARALSRVERAAALSENAVADARRLRERGANARILAELARLLVLTARQRGQG
jgi:hypothetical protein